MPFEMLDRRRVRTKPLAERVNRTFIEKEAIYPGQAPRRMTDQLRRAAALTADSIRSARRQDRSVMLAFGAHTIKNCLGPVLIHMMERGWLTHLATNGAGIIHDWEFAYLGQSSEHVAANVNAGQFGIWEETGHYLNMALLVGAWRGLGYGESVGAMIGQEALEVPDRAPLVSEIEAAAGQRPFPESAAGAADLLYMMDRHRLPSGRMSVPHPWKPFSVQAAACRLGVPFTGHPMIGHDIIYTHRLNHCAAIGRAAQRDFLAFAHGVSRLDGGVYMSIGSAVMSPMIFEKSLSMAQNLAIQAGGHIDRHLMVVVDLQESTWDWSRKEPPEDHPDYYLRYYKTFHRMGGELHYCSADNRDFLLALCQQLEA